MLNFFFIFFTLSAGKSTSASVNLYAKRLQPGQVPYLIQFQTVSACGGVLLAPDWVLTAAQCVMFKRSMTSMTSLVIQTILNEQRPSQRQSYNTKKHIFVEIKLVIFFISIISLCMSRYFSTFSFNGKTAIFVDRPNWNDPTDPPIGVKATYIHPNYDFYSKVQDYEHNVALLKLSHSYIVSKFDKPLQIGPLRLDDSYSSCLIFGWQSTVFPNSRVFAKPVQYAEVLPNAWRVCTYAQGIYGSISNRENIFCAMIESEDGLKTCAGNPGSPLICQNQYGRKILLGIASWTNYSFYCDGLPVYLSVAPFSSWIYELILSTDRGFFSNDSSLDRIETRDNKLHNNSAKLQEIRQEAETENFGEHLTEIDTYKDFRRHYDEPSFSYINDDPHFYVMSGTEMNILSLKIVLWVILTQIALMCTFS